MTRVRQRHAAPSLRTPTRGVHIMGRADRSQWSEPQQGRPGHLHELRHRPDRQAPRSGLRAPLIKSGLSNEERDQDEGAGTVPLAQARAGGGQSSLECITSSYARTSPDSWCRGTHNLRSRVPSTRSQRNVSLETTHDTHCQTVHSRDADVYFRRLRSNASGPPSRMSHIWA